MPCGVARAHPREMWTRLRDVFVLFDGYNEQRSLVSHSKFCAWSMVSRESECHFMRVYRWKWVRRCRGSFLLPLGDAGCSLCVVRGRTSMCVCYEPTLNAHGQLHARSGVSCLQFCLCSTSLPTLIVHTQHSTQFHLLVPFLFKSRPGPSQATHTTGNLPLHSR